MGRYILEPWEKWEHALKVKDEELAALRKENARLRERVDELEREKVDGEFVCINADRAEAAEAKLAKVVSILEMHSEEDLYTIPTALDAAKGE